MKTNTILSKAVSLSLCLAMTGACIPSAGAAGNIQASAVNVSLAKNAAKVTAKKSTKRNVTLTQKLTLYKGETRELDIIRQTGKSKASVVSSNKKVVSVSGRKITAKKCGKSTVTVSVKDGKNTYKVKIKITVRISSYKHSIKYSTEKATNANVPASLVMHRQLLAGNTYKLSLSGQDSVKFSSSNKSIASVSRKGVVKGIRPGSALIKAKVTANGKKYTFYTRIHVYDNIPSPVITQSQIDDFFGSSAFVGSSLGVTQKKYFESKGKGYLGSPAMLVTGCYGFHNDEGANGSQYQLSYNGYTGPARYVIERSGADKVFINMGTNDMFGDGEYVFNNYVSYLNGIRDVNPGLPIYIEAMTPVYSGGEKGHLRNYDVDTLNSLLKSWCKKQNDIYFIDINTPLKDGTDSLPLYYTSDKYVHLTFSAYEVWTDTIIKYVKKKLIKEMKAKDAVNTYCEYKTSSNKKEALKYVGKLHKGALKTSLKNKLR